MAMHKDDFLEKVCEGLGLDAGYVRRIIIDIPFDGFVVAYVETFVSDKMLQIDAMPKDIQIKVVDKETSDGDAE